MWMLVGQALWLAVPVIATGVLHMVIVKRGLLAQLAIPLDGGRMLRGQRIFGDNKTWRGVVVMVVGAAALGLLQGALGGPWAARAVVACIDFAALVTPAGNPADRWDYALGYAVVNAVLGLGYVLGELPNSFLKRQLSIRPGKTGKGLLGLLFFLIDQADSVLAALVLALLLFHLDPRVLLAGLLSLTLLHVGLNAGLHLGGVRRNL